MDDSPQPPGGFQKEMDQAAQLAQRFTAPEPGPPAAAPMVPPANDLFARPHFMDGGWNVSVDLTHWWNGVAWVPGPPPGGAPAIGTSSPLAILVGVIALVVFGMIAFGICQAMPTATGLSPGG